MNKSGLNLKASNQSITRLIKSALNFYLKNTQCSGTGSITQQQAMSEIELFLVHSTAKNIHNILGRANYTNDQIVDILLRHQKLIDTTIKKIYIKTRYH